LTDEREEEGEGVFSDADGAAAGSAHDEDAAFSGGFEVDVIDTNAGAADGAEMRSFVEEVGGDFGGGAYDEGVGVREFGEQSVFGGEDDLPVGLILEELDAAVGDFIGYDDFHWFAGLEGRFCADGRCGVILLRPSGEIFWVNVRQQR
jgi:hypothetical protein